MEIKDFEKCKVDGLDDYFEGKTTIWGGKSELLVDCEEASLETMLPYINKMLEFLDNNKPDVVKALIDDGMLDCAEDWVDGNDETEDSTEEHPCYILYDGSKVCLPITEEDFAASLRPNGMTIYFDEDDISAEIFIDCVPDYFAGHCIVMYLDSKGNINVNGLAG